MTNTETTGNEQSIATLATELFLPVAILGEIVKGEYKGLRAIRDGFACSILEVIKQNLLDLTFIDKLRSASIEGNLVETLNHKLDNLSPRIVIEAPIEV